MRSHYDRQSGGGEEGEEGAVVVRCVALVLREEMLICRAFRRRRRRRCSFVSCFQQIVNVQRLLYYKGLTVDWYRFWYCLQYRQYRYQTNTTGIGPIPIPSTGIGLSQGLAKSGPRAKCCDILASSVNPARGSPSVVTL